MSAAINRIARRAQDRAAQALGQALATEVPDARVSVNGAQVVMEGRGLRQRAAYRWPGGVLR